MMALSGVRSSWDMLARNSDLARLAASARSVSRMHLRLSSTSSRARSCSALARQAEIVDRRHQPALAVDQLLLVLLDLGDVGADRDDAAVLGAQLVDLQPAAVVELALVGAPRSRPLALASRRSDAKAGICCSSVVARRARHHVAVRQAGVLLVLASCTSPAAARRPTARRIRRWSRSRCAAAGRRPRSACARWRCSVTSTAMPIRWISGASGSMTCGAGAHPDPLAVGVAHAEHLVDVVDLARHDPRWRARTGRRRRGG